MHSTERLRRNSSDNAKQHHGLVDDFIGVGENHTPTLSEIYSWCDEFNIQRLTINVDEKSTKRRKKACNWTNTDGCKAVIFERLPQGEERSNGAIVKNYSGMTFLRYHYGGPVASEIKRALRMHLLQVAPHRLMTKLVRYFYKEKGWELIWTPPYCPDLQPIEKLWAFIKNRVGKNYGDRPRTMMELYDEIMVATYGGEIKRAVGKNDKKANRKTLCTGIIDPGFQPKNAAIYFHHCLVNNFNERLKRDPLLGTWVDPKKENTSTDTSTNPLKLDDVSKLEELWGQVLAGGALSTEAAKLKQISIDCNAFPDRRLYNRELRVLPAGEEEEQIPDEGVEEEEAEEAAEAEEAEEVAGMNDH